MPVFVLCSINGAEVVTVEEVCLQEGGVIVGMGGPPPQTPEQISSVVLNLGNPDLVVCQVDGVNYMTTLTGCQTDDGEIVGPGTGPPSPPAP